MKFLWSKRKPCKECPYKLGQIRTLVNSCLQCKLNDYRAFDEFKKQMAKKDENIQ